MNFVPNNGASILSQKLGHQFGPKKRGIPKNEASTLSQKMGHQLCPKKWDMNYVLRKMRKEFCPSQSLKWTLLEWVHTVRDLTFNLNSKVKWHLKAHFHLNWLPTETDHKSDGSDFYFRKCKVKCYLPVKTLIFFGIGFRLKVFTKVRALTFTLKSKVKWFLTVKTHVFICIGFRLKLITKVRGLTFKFETVR